VYGKQSLSTVYALTFHLLMECKKEVPDKKSGFVALLSGLTFAVQSKKFLTLTYFPVAGAGSVRKYPPPFLSVTTCFNIFTPD